ncbi:MAG: CBS domain-containing protein, partial [Chloroflexota bacterium]
YKRSKDRYQSIVTESLYLAPGLQPVEAVAGYLGYVNIAVAVFNLIPGFPLDGGRVLRSILWGARRDRVGATRFSARAGQVVAGLFVVWAAYRIFTGDPGGLWMGLIAYFLYGAATQTLQQERLVQAVGTTRAAQLMTADVRAVPAGMTIGALVRDHMLPFNPRAVPIVDAFGRFAGLVSIGDLRKVEQERWPTTPVDLVMVPAHALNSIRPDDELATTLDRFGEEAPLLPVVDGAGILVGLLYRESVLGYVRMREMLGIDGRRSD